MGNSILYFVDTDLHDKSPQEFLKTLEQRVGSSIKLDGYDESPYASDSSSRNPGEWRLWCYNSDLAGAMKDNDLILAKSSQDVSFSLYFSNNTFEIDDFIVNGKELGFPHGRFNLFCRYLSEDTEETLHDLKLYIDAINKYIRPIVNCSRLLLCGDQVYDDEKEWWDCRLREDGLTIDEVIQMNKESRSPDTLYTWENLNILMADYIGWGLFVFDLSKLPDYLQ